MRLSEVTSESPAMGHRGSRPPITFHTVEAGGPGGIVIRFAADERRVVIEQAGERALIVPLERVWSMRT